MEQKGVNREILKTLVGDVYEPKSKKIGNNSLQKTKRILVWPNITFKHDELEKDSYVQTIYKMIQSLNRLGRTDLFWMLVLPKREEPFVMFDGMDNVDIIHVRWPQFIQTTRGHFDKFSLNTAFEQAGYNHGLKVKRKKNTTIGKTLDSGFSVHWEYYEDEVNWNFNDIDLIFSHLPESTWNLTNYLSNEWHHIAPVLSYCHWFDLKDVCNWQYPAFRRECEGIYLSEKCYINTQSQKNKVLNEAKETYNDTFVSELDRKLNVYHLPVLDNEVVDNINQNPKKIIVFNHRTKTYKDFKNFIVEVADKLWEKRQDFKVWIPLLDLAQMKEIGNKSWDERRRTWLDDQKFPTKDGYHDKLERCCVGYSPKQTYNGWSVATTDGLMRGCPFIMYNEDYYQELNPTADFFNDYKEAIDLLEKYLDDTHYRNSKAIESLEYVRTNLVESIQTKKLSDDIDEVIDSVKPADAEGEGMVKLLRDIKQKGSMTKRELITQRWGSSIKYTQYRRALLNHPNIMEVDGRIPTYVWVENDTDGN